MRARYESPHQPGARGNGLMECDADWTNMEPEEGEIMSVGDAFEEMDSIEFGQ